MRFSRLVIEADQNSVSLSLHPRLTVIAGVSAPIRSVLAGELIGGLASTRSGVHLELAEDHGRELRVFRPTQGSHRVIDDEGIDVSDEYRGEDGRIDLLAHYGVDSRRARELLFLDRSGLQVDLGQDEVVSRLAELDQGELWATAARVRITDDELRVLHESIDHANEGVEAVAKVEQRHQVFETAVERQREIQRNLVRVAVLSFGLAAPIALIASAQILPLLAIGAITILLALVYRARVDAARRAEDAALADAGSTSYLGFVVKQVDGLMSGTEARRRLSAVAEDHRAAAIRWTRLAGDVSVEWAFAHHEEIQSAARLRHQLRSLGQVSTTAPELDAEAGALAHSLISHLGRLRRIGNKNESLPLVLDDPFADLDPSIRLSLLEVLARSAGTPQVVLLTEAEDVANWARLEALTGDVSLIEPLGDRSEAVAADLAV